MELIADLKCPNCQGVGCKECNNHGRVDVVFPLKESEPKDELTEAELARFYHLACMATYSPWDMEAFDRESIDIAHKLFAVIHDQRTALIAWQFQAGGAELRLQRLMDAAQAMREAQTTFENMVPADNYNVIPPDLRQAACAMGDAEDALEGMLAVLMYDVSAAIGGRHD